MSNLNYQVLPITENRDPMVNLSDYPFAIQPMYYEWGVSETPDFWLRKTLADKLWDIQETHLTPTGLQFKIWDPWRPRNVQNNIYEQYRNEVIADHPEWTDEQIAYQVGMFVTRADDPTRIPPHATGGSVDLTVIDENGDELDFGTAFDYFGPEAATDYYKGRDDKPEVRDNRAWLNSLMKDHGFGDDIEEWWHFDYGNQKWALLKGEQFAHYGEVHDPVAFNQRLDNEITHYV